MFKRIITITILLLIFSVPKLIHGAGRDTFEFKTSIVDQDGFPVADGNYNFRFMLYNQSSGGTPLWIEDRIGVPVRRGGVDVDLGAFNPLTPALFSNNSLFLQVCFDANLLGGDGAGECGDRYEEDFQPRKILSSEAWAFRAQSLGPVTIGANETAYNVDTFGQDGSLLKLNFNDQQRLSVESSGNLGLTDGTNTFSFSPTDEKVSLTTDSDIFFGTSSLRNADAADTSGAGLIGVFTGDLQNITGSNLQQVIQNLDPLLRWKANGSSIFYNSGNVGIGTNAPTVKLDVIGVGQFTQGVTIGNNGGTTAGTLRFTGSAFQGYDGVSWVNLAGGGATTDGGAGVTYVTNTTNAFAIGGTTSSSPYFFDPSSGGYAVISHPLNVGSASGFNPVTTLFRENATASGGNYISNLNNIVYTPAGDVGSEVVHGNEINLTVAAGDGSNMLRARGERINLTNNSSGSVAGVLGSSTQVTSNGSTSSNVTGAFAGALNNASYNQILGFSGSAINNSSVFTGGGLIEGSQVVGQNMAGGSAQFLEGAYAESDNYGTVTGQQYGIAANLLNDVGASSGLTYGIRITSHNNGLTNEFGGSHYDSYNDGDTQGYDFNGQRVYALNGSGGTATALNFNGILNTTSNYAAGTVTGDVAGIRNGVSNAGSLFGNEYGIISSDEATTAILNWNQTYSFYSNEVAFLGGGVVVGNNSGTTPGTIRFNGSTFEGFDGITWVTLSGGAGSQWQNDGFGDIYFNTGFVGIGTPTPGSPLDVSGDSNFNGNFTVSTGTTEFNTSVGINTAPSFSLDVLGDSNFNGNFTVGGGTVNFNSDVIIPNGALCVSDGTACPALSAGGVYARLAYAMFDVAEKILADPGVNAGDIVSVKEGQKEVVRKAVNAEGNMIGVISTDPGVVGGYTLTAQNGYSPVPISLAGRVPVKVNGSNGVINPGDPVTSSATPGVGMKATATGKIIGYAMDSFSDVSGAVGKIIVFIQPTYVSFDTTPAPAPSPQAPAPQPQTIVAQPDPAQITQIVNTALQGRIVTGGGTIDPSATQVVVTDANIKAGSVIMLTATSSTGGQMLFVSAQVDGQFTVNVDTAQTAAITFRYLAVN